MFYTEQFLIENRYIQDHRGCNHYNGFDSLCTWIRFSLTVNCFHSFSSVFKFIDEATKGYLP